jgi:predicted dehydrogenase
MPTTVINTSENLRAGFIGGGLMGEVHSRASRAAGAELFGIASSTETSAIQARNRLGFTHAYSSVDELLADDRLDVVHVCTPNASHASLAKAVLESGKSVVCEKPLATTAADALELANLADSSGLTAVVPFVYRFHPMVREARQRVRGGAVGRIFTIQASYLQDWLLSENDDDWRVDSALGGPSRAFADIGSHLCDLIEFVTGDRISRLNAQTRTVHANRIRHSGIDTEDVVAILFETDGGAVGTLLISQVAAGRKNRLSFEISAAHSSLVFDQENPDQLWIGQRDGFHALARDAQHLHAEAARYSLVPAGHPQGYQDAFNALITDAYQSAAGNPPDGLPVFADGYRAAVLTEAVLESRSTGEWVSTIETFDTSAVASGITANALAQ